MALTAEWRSGGQSDVVLILDEEDTVREALAADAAVLSRFLTEMGDLASWHGDLSLDDRGHDPDAWGTLVCARASTGEVLTMDPENYWAGICTWYRSRGVDYDSVLGEPGTTA